MIGNWHISWINVIFHCQALGAMQSSDDNFSRITSAFSTLQIRLPLLRNFNAIQATHQIAIAVISGVRQEYCWIGRLWNRCIPYECHFFNEKFSWSKQQMYLVDVSIFGMEVSSFVFFYYFISFIWLNKISATKYVFFVDCLNGIKYGLTRNLVSSFFCNSVYFICHFASFICHRFYYCLTEVCSHIFQLAISVNIIVANVGSV